MRRGRGTAELRELYAIVCVCIQPVRFKEIWREKVIMSACSLPYYSAVDESNMGKSKDRIRRYLPWRKSLFYIGPWLLNSN